MVVRIHCFGDERLRECHLLLSDMTERNHRKILARDNPINMNQSRSDANS